MSTLWTSENDTKFDLAVRSISRSECLGSYKKIFTNRLRVPLYAENVLHGADSWDWRVYAARRSFFRRNCPRKAQDIPVALGYLYNVGRDCVNCCNKVHSARKCHRVCERLYSVSEWYRHTACKVASTYWFADDQNLTWLKMCASLTSSCGSL